MNTPVITDASLSQSRYHIALLGEETAGQLSLRVQDVEPGYGTPLHLHQDQAETFHVVKGTFRFRAGDTELTGTPGMTIHIPKNTPHCFLYEGPAADSDITDRQGQLISILTPGIHDGFIRNIPEAQENGVAMNELTRMASTYGAEILGPGLKAAN